MCKMMKFCPLCIRNGLKRKIKAFQVNFDEAVWSCEAETCPWPIGFEELTYFARDALSCNWDEEPPAPIGIPEESISMSMELLLYTPPVTPGELSKESTDSVSAECPGNPSSENKLETLVKSKVINSSKKCTDSLPTLELSELESNNFIEERRNSTTEDNANASACRALPKITKIQKTNLDITFLSKTNECCDKEKMYKHNHLPIDESMKDNAENTLFDNILCKEIDLDTQCKRGSEQKNSKVQLDDKMNGAEETNLNDSDASLNINEILEDAINTENYSTENTNNDWLYSLIEDL